MGKLTSKWLDFGINDQQIHAEKLPIDYAPQNYTPIPVNIESEDKLSAHLKGIDEALSGSETCYDATVSVTTDIGVAGSGYNEDHTIFTLPNSEPYDGTSTDLLVFVNGILWEDGVNFNYENSTTATTVTMLTSIPKNSRVRFRKAIRTLSIYDQSILVTTDIGVAGTGYDSDHKVFTLPNGETYDTFKHELLVLTNGIANENGFDVIHEISATATTVTFVEAIPKNTRIRFRKVLV